MSKLYYGGQVFSLEDVRVARFVELQRHFIETQGTMPEPDRAQKVVERDNLAGELGLPKNLMITYPKVEPMVSHTEM